MTRVLPGARFFACLGRQLADGWLLGGDATTPQARARPIAWHQHGGMAQP